MNKTIWAAIVVMFGASSVFAQYTPRSREYMLPAIGSNETATAASGTLARYDGAVRKTVFTFGTLNQTFTDGSDEGETDVLFTFPEGRILILGAAIDCTVTNGADFEASDNDHFFVGIGTVAAADDATLSTTEQDIIAVNDIDTAAGATTTRAWEADMTSGADSVFDGTATAIDLHFNSACADTQISADTTIGITGVLSVTWVFLGDD